MRKAYKAAEWAAVCIIIFVNNLCYKDETDFYVIIKLGGSENEDPDLVECMGSPCNASDMASLVSVPKSSVKCRLIHPPSIRSIILYIVCIMAFVWRAGTTDPPYSPLSRHAALGPRIAISGVLGLGLIYFLLVLNTFRRYGDIMDKNWTDRVAGWTREKISDEKRRHAYQNESQRTRNRSPSYSPTAYDPSIYPHIPNSPNLTRTQFAQPYDRFTPRSPVLNMNGFPLTQNMQSYPSAPSMQGYPPAQSMQAPLPVPIHVPPTPFMRRRSRSRSVSRVQRSEASRDRPPPPQVPWPSNEIYWSNPDYNPIMAPAHSTIIIPSSVFFNTLKVMDLRFLSRTSNPMPDVLFGRGIYVKDWTQFISVRNPMPLLWD
jgi:hypothetical protein